MKTKAKVDRYLADADPGSCPEGKERNPATGRCVKACPEGKKRNAEFKCVKDKTVVESHCPAGKERNPKTRRCVNKCKSGYERNAEFKCAKTRKIRGTSK